jgi:ABC-type proline/glycine betaine transport system substrate-binding protein
MSTSTDSDSTESFARRGPRRLLIALIGIALVAPIAVADTEDCNGIDREIVFAGLDWNSAQLHNYIAGTILQAGFGCEFTDIPGSTIPMVQGLVRGDIDINMEIWFNSAPDLYHESVDSGDVIDLGLNMNALEMSFLVPRYVIEGDADRGIEAMAPDLKTVEDLKMYAEVFKDPEEPSKGRFYNCIIGWQCELINNDKMKTYGLEEHFTNFRPGAAPALAASLAGAYEKGEAWLGYYWGPTPLLGLYEMVPLEEPAWTQECWDGDGGCAFRPSIVNVAVSKGFADEASEEMIAFLSGYEVDQMMVSAYLAHQSSTDAEWADVAREFLMNEAGVWTAWVSDEVASRVQAALDG